MSLSVIILFAPAAASVPIVISDFRRRRISVVWLVVLLAVAMSSAAYFESWRIASVRLLEGVVVTALLLACLGTYLRMRYGASARLDRAFGAGDAYCMIALSPLFPPADLLKLLVAAALLSLTWHRTLNRGRRGTIPFAGMIGLTLIGVVSIRFLLLWLR